MADRQISEYPLKPINFIVSRDSELDDGSDS